MCGIAGLLVPGANPQTLESRVREAASRLKHRGPDEGSFAGREGLAFGHRRLVVIDKEGGVQPFQDSEKRILAVYNGEIYNHHELRKELEREGENFATRSDTEVLVRAFSRWKNKAFEKFDGMFAAALWDERERTLTLARDPAGEKPLFFSPSPLPSSGQKGVAFASEVWALLALLEKTPAVSAAGLWSYLTLGYARAPRLLENVFQVEPGSYLEIRGGVPGSQVRYWRSRPAPSGITKDEALPLIRDTIHQAVASRLESDVPLGAFLSGGVDSSIIVHEMRAAGVRDLRTYSIGFSDGIGYDESKWARQVAKLFQTRHAEQVVMGDETLLESVLDTLDEPMADSSAIAEWALARHARSEITVALGGDGGDEAFCGYERFAGVRLTEMLPRTFFKALRPLAALVPDTKGYGNRGERLRRLLRDAPSEMGERLLRWQAMVPPENARDFLAKKLSPEISVPWPILPGEKSGSAVHDTLRINFESYLPDDLLVKTDRMSMAHSLELRAPFLAKEVVELGHSLPAAGLLKGLSLKVWLREAYRGILPDEILDRRKHGFGVPIHVWLRGRLRPWAEGRLFEEPGPLHDYLDRTAIRKIWEDHLSEKTNAGQFIYGLLVLGHWLGKISK